MANHISKSHLLYALTGTSCTYLVLVVVAVVFVCSRGNPVTMICFWRLLLDKRTATHQEVKVTKQKVLMGHEILLHELALCSIS